MMDFRFIFNRSNAFLVATNWYLPFSPFFKGIMVAVEMA